MIEWNGRKFLFPFSFLRSVAVRFIFEIHTLLREKIIYIGGPLIALPGHWQLILKFILPCSNASQCANSGLTPKLCSHSLLLSVSIFKTLPGFKTFLPYPDVSIFLSIFTNSTNFVFPLRSIRER